MEIHGDVPTDEAVGVDARRRVHAAHSDPGDLCASIVVRGFPFGRSWVSGGGTYDEHLVRDVGVLYLALITVTLWSAWRDELTAAVAIAWAVQGVLHITYHIGHLDALGTVDKIALVGSLAVVLTPAVIAWWAGTQPDRGDRM